MQVFIRFKYFELSPFECRILHDLKTEKIKLILRTNLRSCWVWRVSNSEVRINEDRMRGIFPLDISDSPRSIWKVCHKNPSPFALVLHLVKAIINGIRCLFTWQIVIPEVRHKESNVEDSESFNFLCIKISRWRLSKSYFQVLIWHHFSSIKRVWSTILQTIHLTLTLWCNIEIKLRRD